MITAVKGNHFLLELVILILFVEGICRVFVERVVTWSRDATILGMGWGDGIHNFSLFDSVTNSKLKKVLEIWHNSFVINIFVKTKI